MKTLSTITRRIGRCTEVKLLGWQERLVTSTFLCVNPNLALVIRIRGSSGVSSRSERCAASSPPPDLHRHFCEVQWGFSQHAEDCGTQNAEVPKPEVNKWTDLFCLWQNQQKIVPWQVTHGSLNLLVNVASSAWGGSDSWDLFCWKTFQRSKKKKERKTFQRNKQLPMTLQNYLLHKGRMKKRPPVLLKMEMLAQDQWAY